MRIVVDEDKCTGCGKCKEACPKGAKIWDVNKKAMATNLEYCHLCTICAGKCPEGAIHVIRDEPHEKKNDEKKDI